MNLDQKFLVPGAILFAGVLITGAIYFSNNLEPSKGKENPSPEQAVRGVEAQQEEKTPEFRPVDPEYDHILGAEDAPVTLIVYSDFRCQFCAVAHSTLQQLVDDYKGEVRLVYRHAPVLGSTSAMCAEASECAHEQGRFWEYTDQLFKQSREIDGSKCFLENMANELGLDGSALRECITDNRYADRVAEDLKDAQNVGLRGTPHTLVIGPEGNVITVRGAESIESFKQAITEVQGK